MQTLTFTSPAGTAYRSTKIGPVVVVRYENRSHTRGGIVFGLTKHHEAIVRGIEVAR